MLRLSTLTLTWLISLPDVSDTLAAQQPTPSAPTMASRSVILGYPKPLQPETAFVTGDGEPVLLTALQPCATVSVAC